MAKKPHNYRDAGIGMIVVGGSLAAIGLLSLLIGEDVLYADKIYRANVAEFEKCWGDDDVTSPECKKFKQVRAFQTCLDNLDFGSPGCYKYTMQIQSEIYEECRTNRDVSSPQCVEYGQKVLVGIMEK